MAVVNFSSTGGFARRPIAVTLILSGLFLAVAGNYWAPAVFKFLAGSELGARLELIVPFFPMLFIGTGAALFTSRGNLRLHSQSGR
jgi:hypothetical protein